MLAATAGRIGCEVSVLPSALLAAMFSLCNRMIDCMGLADQTIVAIVNWKRLVQIGLDRRHHMAIV